MLGGGVYMDCLTWLEEWYLAQCDGQWEHAYGVKIDTLDNPGWALSIDLKGTAAGGAHMEPYTSSAGENDWVRCEVKDAVFSGHGDPKKLTFILETFRKL